MQRIWQIYFSEPIKLNDDLTIEAGVTVNFLGVLMFRKTLLQGRLATFILVKIFIMQMPVFSIRQLKMPIWLFYRPR